VDIPDRSRPPHCARTPSVVRANPSRDSDGTSCKSSFGGTNSTPGCPSERPSHARYASGPPAGVTVASCCGNSRRTEPEVVTLVAGVTPGFQGLLAVGLEPVGLLVTSRRRQDSPAVATLALRRGNRPGQVGLVVLRRVCRPRDRTRTPCRSTPVACENRLKTWEGGMALLAEADIYPGDHRAVVPGREIDLSWQSWH